MESTFQVNLFIIRVNTLYIPVYNKSSMHIRAKHAQLSVTYRRHNKIVPNYEFRIFK